MIGDGSEKWVPPGTYHRRQSDIIYLHGTRKNYVGWDEERNPTSFPIIRSIISDWWDFVPHPTLRFAAIRP
jgi:hypothetical protein